MDIVIVLDGSNSIYPWSPMNAFLQKLIPALDIGPKTTQVTSCFSGHNDDLVLIHMFCFVCLFVSWSLPKKMYALSYQVSVIQYGVDNQFEFKLNQYETKDQVLDAVSRITQKFGTSTNTFGAIRYARLVLQ